MVLRPPDSIFQRIVAGRLRLGPEDFLPRRSRGGKSFPPRFPEGRRERLRAKLLQVGIDPVTVGLPPPKPPNTDIYIPPEITYRDAAREIKYFASARRISQVVLMQRCGLGTTLSSSRWPRCRRLWRSGVQYIYSRPASIPH